MTESDFQALQRDFAAHLRDPQAHPAPPHLEDRRVGVYRELFFNNLESLLAGNFPVISRLLPDADWRALVRAFMAGWHSHTPLFTEIGREFHRFLEQRAEHGSDDPPFLAELAHYEWVELAVSIDESRIEDVPHDPAGDVVAGVPVLSPLAWPLAYRYPVHRIREEFRPATPPGAPTFLIVARNRRDEVAFMGANALTLHLLEAVKANPGCTGLDCLHALAAAMEPAARAALVSAGAEILRARHARDVVLGTDLPAI
ncbi:MAG: DUF2063 domain-containing protein [Pseudomonadota bacterium]